MLLSIRDAQHALDQGDCSRAEAISAQILDEEPRNAAAWHLLGLARHKLGRLEPALEALSKAVRQERGVARYHQDLGNALLDDGKVDRAISAFRQALRIDDGLAEIHNDLGAAYFQKSWHAEAEACFRKAIERDTMHAVAYGNLGATLRAQGRLGDSRRAYQRALWLKLRRFWPFSPKKKPHAPAPSAASPDDPDALHLAAIAYEDKRDYESALRCVRQALERRSDLTEYHITHARILVRLGDQDGALRAGNAALRLEPGSAPVHATMAGLFHPWREDLAEKAARHALELDPDSDVAHANLAAALWGQGRLAEAERPAREAVRLRSSEIGYRTNLGLILKDLDRIEEARAVYRDLAGEAPMHGKVCLDIGTLALETEGDLATARRMYRTAQQSGDDPRAFMAEALVDFLEGRYEQAWPNYEARKKLDDQRGHHQQFDFLPDWNGAAVSPGELLVYGEQGLGDEVMFASMFGELGQRAPGTRIVCDPRVAALFARSFPALEVIGAPRDAQRARVSALHGLRCKLAAGNLGAMFRRTASDFPRHQGYLVPDPQNVDAYRARLSGLAGTHKIGLSWIGGVPKTGRNRRSIPLETLLPLLRQPDVAWVSLQYTDAAEAIVRLREQNGIAIHDFRSATADMDELASLIHALDAVVSVCNTTVHVAGAVGKSTLVMAPFVPEWRYGMRDERMVWYPSARVFRQAGYGEWEPVVATVTEALARFV
jgi:tetratricopeptide (TPR) repeat protein/ADP-heptose:LPS heptosyltransferase